MALQVLSLGAGVQSSTLLLMSCAGELPKLDAAVFADTQWESPHVYEHLAWLETQAAAAGIPLYRVSAGNLREHSMKARIRGLVSEGNRSASMPLYTLSPQGNKGRIKRQCTNEYKLTPIERCIRREVLKLRPRQVAPLDAVDQWIGISADESRRVRASREHWRRNVYPLLGFPHDFTGFAHPWTRLMCREWLLRHYPDHHVPRSSCLGCPFHSNEEWLEIKGHPALWADVCEVDRAIREDGASRGRAFLHRSCLPLENVDLGQSQFELGFEAECLGLCGN